MSLLTERAVFQAFGEMLFEMPFDKITVTGLTKRCGISTNTFYYHYEDINELLNVWLVQLIESTIAQSPEENWKDKIKRLCRLCKDHPQQTYHIWNSLSREQVERMISRVSNDAIYREIQEYSKTYGVPEKKIEEISQFCRYAYIGFFMLFLWKKMDVDIDTAVDELSILLENFVESSVNLFKTENRE